MNITFIIASFVAVLATIMAITRYNLIHALLYLVISFLSIAIVFFVLGAPFVAALEIIVYAGAIVVLIIFVIMMLNLKEESVEQERIWFSRKVILGPSILSIVLLGELIYILLSHETTALTTQAVDAKSVGLSLYGPYIIGVELSGLLLMSGVVGAYHLGRQKKKVQHRFLENQTT
ncbi:NADH-quinone oxidoreductase subunit J [Pseudochryseolinea flava]|uniref:NADH-quinone oxidoreductase subunit J n=1 Tax=Pseudochryseolinea flava TaxID=2059302 RepID=A0A364Y2V5_9BACT|nr:NADH-quinone oxidoreductase subunit J [Pseudochryseolinea flava]RAW00310.1 NADH-quinone oxidoreductase subunit J [Pseudochryseolinea flava]